MNGVRNPAWLLASPLLLLLRWTPDPLHSICLLRCVCVLLLSQVSDVIWKVEDVYDFGNEQTSVLAGAIGFPGEVDDPDGSRVRIRVGGNLAVERSVDDGNGGAYDMLYFGGFSSSCVRRTETKLGERASETFFLTARLSWLAPAPCSLWSVRVSTVCTLRLCVCRRHDDCCGQLQLRRQPGRGGPAGPSDKGLAGDHGARTQAAHGAQPQRAKLPVLCALFSAIGLFPCDHSFLADTCFAWFGVQAHLAGGQ